MADRGAEARSSHENERLPSFRNPPVSEVVLSVGFEPLERLDSIAIAQLWRERFGVDFPAAQERVEYNVPNERFGREARLPEVRLDISDRPPSHRFWFLNSDGTELVQIQHDWFARNWRKLGSDLEYPRYRVIREAFRRDLLKFKSFVEEQGIGVVKPLQCEITYVNEIRMTGALVGHQDFLKLIRVGDDSLTSGFLPLPERASFAISFIIPNSENGEPQGRLHVSAKPGFTVAEDLPIYILTLTARGLPLGDDVNGVLGFLDIGHEWSVRAFAQLTSEASHKLWGRQDDE